MSAQRAGAARDAFRRTAKAAATPADTTPATPPAAPAVAPAVEPPATATAPPRSKYTLLLSESDAVMWDELAMALRRDLRRRVDKSAIVRALVYLASEDGDLRRQVAEQITRDATA